MSEDKTPPVETEVETTTPTPLEAFRTRLDNHDWFFSFSDDGGVWKRGKTELEALKQVAAQNGDDFGILFQAYQDRTNAAIASQDPMPTIDELVEAAYAKLEKFEEQAGLVEEPGPLEDFVADIVARENAEHTQAELSDEEMQELAKKDPWHAMAFGPVPQKVDVEQLKADAAAAAVEPVLEQFREDTQTVLGDLADKAAALDEPTRGECLKKSFKDGFDKGKALGGEVLDAVTKTVKVTAIAAALLIVFVVGFGLGENEGWSVGNPMLGGLSLNDQMSEPLLQVVEVKRTGFLGFGGKTATVTLQDEEGNIKAILSHGKLGRK
jgi:hypothetical protein